jgi:hypothetical protein
MNVQERNEIRELTTAELDGVTGGSIIVNAIRTAWTRAYSMALMSVNEYEIVEPDCVRATGCDTLPPGWGQ